ITAVRVSGLRTAIVTSSANTAAVLEAGGVSDLFDAQVDAPLASSRGLRGKPAPDTFLEASRMLDAEPRAAAVFEDALAGVTAGRAGGGGVGSGGGRGGDGGGGRGRAAGVGGRGGA